MHIAFRFVTTRNEHFNSRTSSKIYQVENSKCVDGMTNHRLRIRYAGNYNYPCMILAVQRKKRLPIDSPIFACILCYTIYWVEPWIYFWSWWRSLKLNFIIIYLGRNTRIYKVDLSIIKFVEQKTTLRLKYIFEINKNYDVYLFNFLYFY